MNERNSKYPESMYEVSFQLRGDDPLAEKLHSLVGAIATQMNDSVEFCQTMVVNVRTHRQDVAAVLRMLAEGSQGVAVVPAGNGGNGAAKPKAMKASKPNPEREKKPCVECGSMKRVNADGLCVWCEKRLAKANEVEA